MRRKKLSLPSRRGAQVIEQPKAESDKDAATDPLDNKSTHNRGCKDATSIDYCRRIADTQCTKTFIPHSSSIDARTTENKSLPRSPWAASSRKLPRPSPAARSSRQLKDVGIIDLTSEGGSTSSVAALNGSQSTTPPKHQPPALPSSPAIEPKPARGGEQTRSTYLRHFEGAMEFVMFSRRDYAMLFTSQECAVVRRFSRLSRGAKSLYVRLFQRKGPWFRVDGMLGYDEVGSGTPLWIRRRDALAASAASRGTCPDCITSEGMDTGEHDCQLSSFPSSPFSPKDDEKAPVESDYLIDGIDSCLQDIDKATRTENSTVIETRRNELGAWKAVTATGVWTDDKVTTPSERSKACSETAVSAPIKLTPQELTTLHEDVQSCLCELVNAEFLDPLPSDVWGKGSRLDDVLASVACCLKSAEIKTLLRKTGGVKSSARAQRTKATGRALSLYRGPKEGGADGTLGHPARGSDSVLGRSGGRGVMIEELHRRLAGQQTLWGAKLPLVREIERLVISSLEDLKVEVNAGSRCGGNPGDGERANGTKEQRRHFLLRAAGSPQVVFRRALRLMYLTSNTSALSSGRVGAASVRGPQVAGAMSSWSPGLAAAFGKARYAPYACNPQTRIFGGRDNFLRWEAAVELRCALDGALTKLPRGWPETTDSAGSEGSDEEKGSERERPPYRVPSQELMPGYDGEHGSAAASVSRGNGSGMTHDFVHGCTPLTVEDVVRAAVDDDLQDSVAQFFPGDHRQAATMTIPAVPKAACAAVAISLLSSMCLYVHLGTRASNRFVSKAREFEGEEEEELLNLLKKACWGGNQSGCVRQSLVDGEIDKERKSPSEASDGTVASDTSQQEYLLPRPELICGEDRGLPPRVQAAGNPCTAKRSRSPAEGDFPRDEHGVDSSPYDGGETGRQVPDFLLQLEAGWVLASAVWDGVALLEKVRDYERAVELLTQLLATRYTPHRRGRWWTRLSLDLAHTARHRCALWAAEEGIRDPQVRGGDRLALARRVTMLTNRSSSNQSRRSAARSPLEGRASQEAAASSPTRQFTSPPLGDGIDPPKKKIPLTSFSSSPPSSDMALQKNDSSSAYPETLDLACDGEDEGDIFEDPSVERQRQRRLRRQKRRRLLQRSQLEKEQPANLESGDERRKRQEVSSAPLPTTKREETAAAAAPSSTPCSTGSDARVVSRRLESVEITRADGGEESLHTADGDNTRKLAAPEGATSVAATAATIAKLELEKLSELLQIRDLLDDDSVVAAVVEASAGPETQGDEGDEGGGVPEMSITGRRLNREVGIKSRFVGYDDSTACSVESLVLQHLSQQDAGSWAGWHCEGSPVRGLWALLMWDIIFADVPDVFQTPFQDAPLDLDHCPLFYLNRRAAVDARLSEIRVSSPGTLVALVAKAWEANANTVCRGLRWEGTSVRYLQAAAAGLGGRGLAAAFAALCLNFKHFGGGLPDLLLMRAVRTGVRSDPLAGDSSPSGVAAAVTPETEVSTPTRFASWLGVDLGAPDANRGAGERRARAGIQSGEEEARHRALSPRPPLEAADIDGFRVEAWLLEVKGPGDRLSDRQTAWLRILDHGGARVGVCRVTEGSGGSHVVPPRGSTKKRRA